MSVTVPIGKCGGEIQVAQLHNKEAGMVKDYQLSMQVKTVYGPVDSILPVYNESTIGIGSWYC